MAVTNATSMVRVLAEVFWSPSIWLPPNVTWSHFEDRPDSAQFHHLLLPFPLALLLLLLRRLVEHLFFRPFGRWLGVPDPPRRWEEQPVLEKARASGKAWSVPTLSR